MDSDHFEAELEAYLDGELDARAKAVFEERLAADPEAAALLAARRDFRRTIRAGLAADAPDHLRASILETAAKSAPPRPRRSQAAWIGELGRAVVAALRPPRRLVPALAAAAVVVFLVARGVDFAPEGVETAFAEPAAVIVLRYDESEPGGFIPELGGVVLGAPR